MNIKTIAWIIVALVVGLIAVELFVPRKMNGEGKVTVFGDSNSNEEKA